MLFQSMRMQLKVMLERKNVIVMFFVLLILVLVNFFSNVYTYSGRDVVDMYHPMKLLLLSSHGAYGFYLMQYYPLLVIIPAGFAYVSDKSSSEIFFIQSRVGIKNYYIGKMLTVFLVTFLIFTVPFLIEIGLNCIAFPIRAVGDPSNRDTYDLGYMDGVRRYLFHELYICSIYLYTIFFTLLFGIVSGFLAVFTVAISTFSIKYKVLLFLPVYILLYVLGMLKQIIPGIEESTSHFDYFRMFDGGPKSTGGYFMIVLSVLCVSVAILIRKSRKDSL